MAIFVQVHFLKIAYTITCIITLETIDNDVAMVSYDFDFPNNQAE